MPTRLSLPPSSRQTIPRTLESRNMLSRARPIVMSNTMHRRRLISTSGNSTLPTPIGSGKAGLSQKTSPVSSAATLSPTRPSPGSTDLPPPTPSQSLPTPSIQLSPTSTLLRSYLVYTLCSLPFLIDSAPSLLQFFTRSPIPGLKGLTEWGVRRTFFAQFVPGETVQECTVTMKELRARGVGSVLNYSAEAEEEVAAAVAKPAINPSKPVAGGAGGVDGAVGPAKRVSAAEGAGISQAKELEKRRLKEVHLALAESGKFEMDVEAKGGGKGSTGFALKITGLIDPTILQRASTTLLRMHAASQSSGSASSVVPYPGEPTGEDAKVIASASVPDELFNLSGGVENMGVLETDEGIRQSDVEELKDLWDVIKDIGVKGKHHNVKLYIDAEHTWYQPALDAYTLLLSQEFNVPPSRPSSEWSGPLIYGTYQSYLLRQPAYLDAMLQHADQHGYALGIKIVRGAYFMQERKKWKEEAREGPDPIWPTKPATDTSYNGSIKTILSTLSSQLSSSDRSKALSVVFGTHNPESVDLIIQGLKDNGLAEVGSNGRLRMRDDVKGKVGIAQLYGMKDDLMDRVVQTFEPSKQPVSLKYIAYGKLDEVIPFLGRRAIENKSLMSGEGGAAFERRRISGELMRRWFGRQPAIA